MLWVPITVAAAVAQLARNALQSGLTATVGTLGATMVRFVYALPFALVAWAVAVWGVGEPIPEISPGTIEWTLAGALAQIGATALMLKAMDMRGFAVAYAYIKTEPVLLAIGGWLLLGDRLPGLAWGGIVIATAGVIWSALPKGTTLASMRGEMGAIAYGVFGGALFGLSSLAFRAAILTLDSEPWMGALHVLTLNLAMQSAIGTVGALLAPAVAAISLGMVGRDAFEERLGRNASLGAIGNVAMAGVLGVAGAVGGARVMFGLVIAMSLVTVACVLRIRPEAIDDDLARGADPDDAGRRVQSWTVVLHDVRLRVLGLCAVLFHGANAVLLTLVAQLFGHRDPGHATLYLGAAVAVTQLIVVPLGVMVGRAAHRLPRKPVFAVAFLVLPLRCLLYTLGQDPRWLLALQVLDGIAAGVFGVMQVLVIADLTRGTGHFNLANGSLGMAVGVGAAVSNALGGWLVVALGYRATFLVMAGIAGLAAATFLLRMPETRRRTLPPRVGGGEETAA